MPLLAQTSRFEWHQASITSIAHCNSISFAEGEDESAVPPEDGVGGEGNGEGTVVLSGYQQPAKAGRNGRWQSLGHGTAKDGLGYNDGSLPLRSHSRSRSLLSACYTASTMTTDLMSSSDTAPGSPPGLMNSKSSKSSSSSFRSYGLGDNISTPDTNHFEEISLEDMNQALIDEAWSSRLRSAGRSPPSDRCPRDGQTPHSVLSSVGESRDGTQSVGRQRDLMRLIKPRPKRLDPHKLAGNGSAEAEKARGQQALTFPFPHMLKSPSTPSLSPRSILRSRSSSPTPGQLKHRLASNPVSPALKPPSRPQSRQQHRKSVKELEDEYDDLDEDVPGDAFIWNVPLSPRPPHERTQDSASDASRGLEPAQSLKHTTSAPPVLFVSAGQSPTYMKDAQLFSGMAGAEGAAHPSKTFNPSCRSIALSELSDEAKILTEKLEAFAEERGRKHEQKVQSSHLHNRSNSTDARMEKVRQRVSSADLPPVRKGNVMIDPLPISKEKERFLTRTRPSWLPPKDQKEEKRHVREYQKMMAHAAEADRKRAAKVQTDQQQRDEHLTKLTQVWDTEILPNWATSSTEPRTRDLAWQGIAPQHRGAVWLKAVGNSLTLSEATFETALARAKATDIEMYGLSDEERLHRKEADWFGAIRRDMSEVWPQSKLFQPGAPLHQTLVDVLMAYAVYRADVGYVYGIHFPAALMCLSLPPAQAFVCLANVLNRALPLSILLSTQSSLAHFHELLLDRLASHVPRLHAHLTQLPTPHRPDDQVPASSYLDPFLTSLGTWRLPIDVAVRIWDVYVFEGDRALIWAAVALLTRLESRLYVGTDEVLDLLGWRRGALWDVGPEDEYMAVMKSVAGRR